MNEHLDKRNSLVAVMSEELIHKVLIIIRETLFKGDLCYFIHNVILHSQLIFPSEGSIAMHQLIKQDTQRPDINLVVMTLLIQHLWSHIFKGTAESFPLLHTLQLLLKLESPCKVTNLN